MQRVPANKPDANKPAPSTGFEAQANRTCRLLILGSLPGQASLQAQQYYAHPRNAFWPIMAEYLKFDASDPYAERMRHLAHANIGLWDVIACARREGSLDANILKPSIEPNDFGSFFAQHPQCRTVLLNGASAFKLFEKRVAPELSRYSLNIEQMPSTSPAFAAMPYQEKRRIWHNSLRLSEYTL